MKKRILLSLVSFFAMTAMWASITDAYQIYVKGANGKTYGTAELTLNMKNKNAIAIWKCTLVLPEGITYKDVAVVDGRYPEGFNAVIKAVPGNNNEVAFTCSGAEGLTLTGTDGAVATVTVDIPGTVQPGEYIVKVKDIKLFEPGPGEEATIHEKDATEFKWIIEQGEEPSIKGDLNGDGKVAIADAIAVLNVMAAGSYEAVADLNNDQVVDIKDFVAVLNIIAAQ